MFARERRNFFQRAAPTIDLANDVFRADFGTACIQSLGSQEDGRAAFLQMGVAICKRFVFGCLVLRRSFWLSI
jgi:hypothetical protein